MHYAYICGLPNIIELILEANVEVHVTDNEKQTPLLGAVMYRHIETMAILLNYNPSNDWNEPQWQHDLGHAGVNVISVDSTLLHSIHLSSTLSEVEKSHIVFELAEYLIQIHPKDYMSYWQLGNIYVIQGRLLKVVSLLD